MLEWDPACCDLWSAGILFREFTCLLGGQTPPPPFPDAPPGPPRARAAAPGARVGSETIDAHKVGIRAAVAAEYGASLEDALLAVVVDIVARSGLGPLGLTRFGTGPGLADRADTARLHPRRTGTLADRVREVAAAPRGTREVLDVPVVCTSTVGAGDLLDHDLVGALGWPNVPDAHPTAALDLQFHGVEGGLELVAYSRDPTLPAAAILAAVYTAVRRDVSELPTWEMEL